MVKSSFGPLLTTELDNRLADQRALAAAFQSGGVPLQFKITPNIGRWYPPDLVEKIAIHLPEEAFGK
jgi:hypothetical protein